MVWAASVCAGVSVFTETFGTGSVLAGMAVPTGGATTTAAVASSGAAVGDTDEIVATGVGGTGELAIANNALCVVTSGAVPVPVVDAPVDCSSSEEAAWRSHA